MGLAAADAAAAELGISRRQVYVLLGRWRAGERVVPDLLPSAPAAAGSEPGYRRRIEALDPAAVVTAREGADGARRLPRSLSASRMLLPRSV
ncbi:hypothetical protein [Nonomuraea sp. NPDC049480]|uniref:hypothetical protein n=1 Tax=Nonomuraea sp. NPDC049480 TaxID=3364353 RepID=UPI00379DE704